MKRSKFTEAQIAFALLQAEPQVSVEEGRRNWDISYATYYVWRRKYGGIGPSGLRRPRAAPDAAGRSSVLKAHLICTT